MCLLTHLKKQFYDEVRSSLGLEHLLNPQDQKTVRGTG